MSTAKKSSYNKRRGNSKKKEKPKGNRERIGQEREENGKEEWTQTRMYRNRYERFMSGL